MQGIEFEEGNNLHSLKAKTLSTPVAKQGFLMGLVEKTGIADKTTANFILLGIAMIFFGITIFLYAGILGESVPSKLSAEQITAQQKAMNEMLSIK